MRPYRTWLLLIGLALPSLGSAAEVTEIAVFKAPPAAVWKQLRGFCSIERWQSLVKDCRVRGSGEAVQRVITMRNGDRYTESLVEYSESSRQFSYAMDSGPLPIENYQADFWVQPTADGNTRIVWRSTFEVAASRREKIVEDVRALYRNGIEGMRRLVER